MGVEEVPSSKKDCVRQLVWIEETVSSVCLRFVDQRKKLTVEWRDGRLTLSRVYKEMGDFRVEEKRPIIVFCLCQPSLKMKNNDQVSNHSGISHKRDREKKQSVNMSRDLHTWRVILFKVVTRDWMRNLSRSGKM